MVAHEVAEQAYGQRRLAAARSAVDGDDRSARGRLPAQPWGALGRGHRVSQAVRGLVADPGEGVLLVPDQGEGRLAGQNGPDMLQEPGRRSPPDCLEGGGLRGAQRAHAVAAQKARQGRGRRRQIAGGQDGDVLEGGGGRAEGGPLLGGGVVQHHHGTQLQTGRPIGTPVPEEAPVGGDLVDGMRGHHPVGAHDPTAVQDPAGLPLLQLDYHQDEPATRRGTDQQRVQAPPSARSPVLQVHPQIRQAGPHQGRDERRPTCTPAPHLTLARNPEPAVAVTLFAPRDERGTVHHRGDLPDGAGRHARDIGRHLPVRPRSA